MVKQLGDFSDAVLVYSKAIRISEHIGNSNQELAYTVSREAISMIATEDQINYVCVYSKLLRSCAEDMDKIKDLFLIISRNAKT